MLFEMVDVVSVVCIDSNESIEENIKYSWGKLEKSLIL